MLVQALEELSPSFLLPLLAVVKKCTNHQIFIYTLWMEGVLSQNCRHPASPRRRRQLLMRYGKEPDRLSDV